ncbi:MULTISPECIES: class I SAM-dependent methyltransferase [unclassified Herbaspirillum]|uniref:class I SAM-dependent methyltransferase n=1 Tax=unclassified Herbaspirillum TaxID=2624150 RepID=UPI000E2EBB7C|nr:MULTISPECIES: class I SAM-dependent methyltransferase [unclassified Herbaspirillum]RFB67136.1 class I SAM-dependent methyltransferase [Herbaspirillum sp. 3R-3a1]TFI06176.1 class I SAM-dependent methyltransferase [Herbaspirillum sp. 3R11]TFI14211.1 class I SAM-dependent methyltransferase [Herbaspirillum sp. 3R-11]TFI28858.1 class I SAM-dependent methyltransferase [Herbaspirillum sp. 3C11]
MNTAAPTICIVCGSGMSVFIDKIWDDRYGCPGVFSIQRCHICTQMATTPPLKESDLPALYSTYYPRRSVEFEGLEKEASKVLEPHAKTRRWFAGTDNQGHYLAKPGQKVLDIGSGSCLSLLEQRNLGVEGYGVEADPNVRRIADHFGLRVHVGSIHDQPFPGETFDMIVLNQVIEHVPDPEALMLNIRHRLKPDGRAVMSFPNAASLQRKLSGHKWINWHVPYHQHHFNRQSFRKLAEKTGYEVISARTITPNLWSVLQLRAMAENTTEGQASGGWSSGSVAAQRISFVTRVKRGLARRMSKLLTFAMIVVNRTVDMLGQGDSLLVELRARPDTNK